MEASTIPAATALAAPQRARATGGPLLRLRSDEQLVRMFRMGSEEAFRVIHDRYRPRLYAYARQMLAGSKQDAEDALQDVFVRAYAALRADAREVSLRAWLYRIAHNRCIDELRRPPLPAPEVLELIRPPASDPMAVAEQRETLRRLVADVRRLPEQQRSALLMREITGMSYGDLAGALDVSVPAVKSLLVRARVGLAAAAEARDTECVTIREQLAAAHDRGVRASGLARRHLHDCDACRAYRRELRAMGARFAALTPAFGPGALVAKLLGLLGGGGGAGAGVAGGACAGAGAAGGAATAGTGVALGLSVSHVAAVVAVAVVGAGGAVEVQRTLVSHHARHPPAPIVRHLAAPTVAASRTAPPLPVHHGRAAPAKPPADEQAATPAASGDPAGTTTTPDTGQAPSPSAPTDTSTQTPATDDPGTTQTPPPAPPASGTGDGGSAEGGTPTGDPVGQQASAGTTTGDPAGSTAGP